MSKWKDETRHGAIVESSIRVGVFKSSAHHYIGCGETWFAPCDIFDRCPNCGPGKMEVVRPGKIQCSECGQ